MNKYKKIVIASVLLILFIVNTVLVCLGKTDCFDESIYNIVFYFNGDVITTIFKIITFFGSTLFVIALLVVNLIMRKNKEKAIFYDLNIIVGYILSEALKLLIARPRPELINLVEESSYSYPSGHTMISTLVYGMLMYEIFNSEYLDKKKKIILCTMLSILILLIAISRIYLGAHYATDIIGGFLLGVLFLLGYTALFKNKLR